MSEPKQLSVSLDGVYAWLVALVFLVVVVIVAAINGLGNVTDPIIRYGLLLLIAILELAIVGLIIVIAKRELSVAPNTPYQPLQNATEMQQSIAKSHKEQEDAARLLGG